MSAPTFITLTTANGRSERVAVAHIIRYGNAGGGQTFVATAEKYESGETFTMIVTETPEQIDALLGMSGPVDLEPIRALLTKLSYVGSSDPERAYDTLHAIWRMWGKADEAFKALAAARGEV